MNNKLYEERLLWCNLSDLPDENAVKTNEKRDLNNVRYRGLANSISSCRCNWIHGPWRKFGRIHNNFIMLWTLTFEDVFVRRGATKLTNVCLVRRSRSGSFEDKIWMLWGVGKEQVYGGPPHSNTVSVYHRHHLHSLVMAATCRGNRTPQLKQTNGCLADCSARCVFVSRQRSGGSCWWWHFFLQ